MVKQLSLLALAVASTARAQFLTTSMAPAIGVLDGSSNLPLPKLGEKCTIYESCEPPNACRFTISGTQQDNGSFTPPSGICAQRQVVAVGQVCDNSALICDEETAQCLPPPSYFSGAFQPLSPFQAPTLSCQLIIVGVQGAACNTPLVRCGKGLTCGTAEGSTDYNNRVCKVVTEDLAEGQKCDYEANFCAKGLACAFPNRPSYQAMPTGTCQTPTSKQALGAACDQVRRCASGLVCDIIDFTCTEGITVADGAECEPNFCSEQPNTPPGACRKASRACASGSVCVTTPFTPSSQMMQAPVFKCAKVTIVATGATCSNDLSTSVLRCGKDDLCSYDLSSMAAPPMMPAMVPGMLAEGQIASPMPAYTPPAATCKKVTTVALGANCDDMTLVCAAGQICYVDEEAMSAMTTPMQWSMSRICKEVVEAKVGAECGPRNVRCVEGSQCRYGETNQKALCVQITTVAEGELCNYYDVDCEQNFYCSPEGEYPRECYTDDTLPQCTPKLVCQAQPFLVAYGTPYMAQASQGGPFMQPAPAMAIANQMGQAEGQQTRGWPESVLKAVGDKPVAMPVASFAGKACTTHSDCGANGQCNCMGGARRRLLFGGHASKACVCK